METDRAHRKKLWSDVEPHFGRPTLMKRGAQSLPPTPGASTSISIGSITVTSKRRREPSRRKKEAPEQQKQLNYYYLVHLNFNHGHLVDTPLGILRSTPVDLYRGRRTGGNVQSLRRRRRSARAQQRHRSASALALAAHR